MAVVGSLPAGTKILGMTPHATIMVIATDRGVYVIQGGKLEPLEPEFTKPVLVEWPDRHA